ncbi:hypothetical protein MLD38_032576 [Melastoma candidum]|uniref:Uncharacterized protein n=1 Tax=Melastoma candidum TaxID=119954 RepID=A0ACB9M4F6_9MYRT|nr:hypothetical protein MLD38_032576 [Melastoma candidum]
MLIVERVRRTISCLAGKATAVGTGHRGLVWVGMVRHGWTKYIVCQGAEEIVQEWQDKKSWLPKDRIDEVVKEGEEFKVWFGREGDRAKWIFYAKVDPKIKQKFLQPPPPPPNSSSFFPSSAFPVLADSPAVQRNHVFQRFQDFVGPRFPSPN